MVFSCCRSKTSFSNPQDAFLSFSAGEKGGESPITKADRKNALAAQPHPIGNKCLALTTQILPSIAWTGFLYSAYLLATHASSIVGGDICKNCPTNIEKFNENQRGALWNQAAGLFSKASNATISMWNQAMNSSLTEETFTQFDSHAKCENGTYSGIASCSLFNYAGNFIQTTAQNPFVLAAGFGLILGWHALRHLERSHNQETATEKQLVEGLQKKYNEMSDRLKNRAFCCGPEESEKAKAIATGIIHRQDAINQEIVSLGIPSISTVREANKITKSLFVSARAIADLEIAPPPQPKTEKEEPKIQAEPQKETEEPKIVEITEGDVEVDDVDAAPAAVAASSADDIS